jgi:hypothetical protein
VPLAQLLLTKLQIVRLNEKDLLDIWVILVACDVAEHDDDAVNRLCRARVRRRLVSGGRPGKPSRPCASASLSRGWASPTVRSWTTAWPGPVTRLRFRR